MARVPLGRTVRLPPPRASNTPLVLGALLALFGLPCDALGVAMMATPKDAKQADAGLALVLISLVLFGVPAAVLLALGGWRRLAQGRLERLAALGAAHVRLPVGLVASELGLAEPRARQLMYDAIHAGYLRGRMDLEHGVFVSASAEASVQAVAFACRSCGGRPNVVVTPGHRPVCPYCRAALG
jgi:hypothetical protein